MHNGRTGAAIAVRVTPRASQNAVVEILHEGTVKIHLTVANDEEQINKALIEFLAKVLGIPASRLEVVAGKSGYDKLVSIIDLDAQAVHERILKSLT